MRLNLSLACFLAGILTLASCIRNEALNTEADIEKCILPEGMILDTQISYTLPFDEKLNAYPIYIKVKKGTNLRQLAPEFELTPGATIEPASGSTQNFTQPVRYTVTSEDDLWHRTYALIITPPEEQSIPTIFHFDNVEQVSKYYVFYEEAPGHSRLTWASGNQGFALTGSGSGPDDYPTTISANGMVGKCLKLVTRETGGLGQKVGKPIAAGNLFIGQFELLNALGDALAATKFGTTFFYKPTRLTGYYKYQAGPRFYEDGEYTDRKDVFNIYALFYEKTADTPTLDGHITSTNFEHPNMVAAALIDSKQAVESDTWKRFEIPFDYARYGKTIDATRLAAGEYNVAIVFSASKGGDQFKGAPGSTLLIDEVELEYEEINEE